MTHSGPAEHEREFVVYSTARERERERFSTANALVTVESVYTQQ